MKETNDKVIPANRVNTLINRIQKVYLFIMVIVVLDLIYNLLSDSQTVSLRERLQGVLILFTYLSIYIGLKLRKKWVIPLILISSAFLLLSTFISGFEPANDIFGLISKVTAVILVVFCAYQIHFFSKREVRDFLGTRETIIF